MQKIYFSNPKIKLEIDWQEGPKAIRFVKRSSGNPVLSEEQMKFLSKLDDYFLGKRISFREKWKLQGTDFQKAVWLETSKIAYGSFISYAELARRIGRPKAVRAVGAALGKNPLPILIPCHRVLSSSGALHGFAGGLSTKSYLLELEGCLETARLRGSKNRSKRSFQSAA